MEHMQNRDLSTADVVRWLLHWLVYFFLYGWLVMLMSLIGGIFGGMLGKTVQHWAWIIGAVAGLIGVPTGLKVSGRKISHPPWRPSPLPPDPDPPITKSRSHRDRQLWLTRDALFGGFFGGLFGIILGFVVLVPCWFSISMSPFAPAAWSGSVTSHDPVTATDRMDRQNRDSVGVETQHPLVFVLGLGPPAVLSLLGFVLGGFGVGGGQYRLTKTKVSPKKKCRRTKKTKE